MNILSETRCMKSLTFNCEPEDGRGLLPDRVLHLAVVLAYGNEYIGRNTSALTCFCKRLLRTDVQTDGQNESLC